MQPENDYPDWQPRPLSQGKEREVITETGEVLRYDMHGRRLCRATRKDGEWCKAPAVTGMRVCRIHGGSTQHAKKKAQLRLQELVAPAIAQLGRLLATSENESVRLKASTEILDRTGYGRQMKLEATDAKELLYQRMLEMHEETQEREAEEYGERLEDDYIDAPKTALYDRLEEEFEKQKQEENNNDK